MIRLFIILVLFIFYVNFNIAFNDIFIFSLINIAFYTILNKKKITNIDVSLFIFSTLIIEVFLGLPILISVVILSIPLLSLNYVINNYNLALIVKSLIIFFLSFITFFLLDQTIILRLLNFQYLTSILILTIIFIGLSNYGKE